MKSNPFNNSCKLRFIFLFVVILLFFLPFVVSVETKSVSEFNTMMILGGHIRSEMENRVRGGYELIKQGGNFNKLILTGGCVAADKDATCQTCSNGCNEADEMEKYLKTLDPNIESKVTIIKESKSGTTSANLKNSKDFVQIGEKVLVVSDHQHVRPVAYCLRYSDPGADAFFYYLGQSSQPELPPITIPDTNLDYTNIAKNCPVNYPPNQQQTVLPTSPLSPTPPLQSGISGQQYTTQKFEKIVPQRYKEIDQVWLQISQFVGGVTSGTVWDNLNGDWAWRQFDDVYFELRQVATSGGGVITGQATASQQGFPAVDYQVPLINVPPELQPCVQEVGKLAKVAIEMTSWNSCGENKVPDVCNPTSTNTCCYMSHSGCCYGIPNDPINDIGGSCQNGCCGSYVWQVFNVAINKYNLHVSWPLYLNPSTRNYERDPGDIQSEYKQLKLPHWNNPGLRFDAASFKPQDLIPGDIVYFKWPKDYYGKCPEAGSSHINIVGPPTADGKAYEIIDIACKKDGLCKFGKKWTYPTFLYEKTYCTDQKNSDGSVAEPLKAGEAWIYVFRVIPECIDATLPKLASFRTENSGVRAT